MYTTDRRKSTPALECAVMSLVVPTGVPAAQYQAQIEALKAMLGVIAVEEETFRLILRSRPHPTIVAGKTGALWFKKPIYMTSYDGFLFILKPDSELDFKEDAPGAFFVEAKAVHVPFM